MTSFRYYRNAALIVVKRRGADSQSERIGTIQSAPGSATGAPVAGTAAPNRIGPAVASLAGTAVARTRVP
jgi:hypothetical protein